MDALIKNMDGIRKMMDEMKSEQYAIENYETQELEEYRKNLYIKLLCTVVQYGNTPGEMQVLFLKRLVKGMKAEQPLEEYMRMALDVSETDVKEFVEFIKESDVRFYFTLEGLLLVALGNHAEKEHYEYFAELIELCSVTKEDLSYLSAVAKSVLQQSSPLFEEAKALVTDVTSEINVFPYIKNYYCGFVSKTREKLIFTSPQKVKISECEILRNEFIDGKIFSNHKVLFENCVFDLPIKVNFSGCLALNLFSCDFLDQKSAIKCVNCDEVNIYDCHFEGYTSKVFKLKGVNSTNIDGCQFKHCWLEYITQNDWSYYGCVFSTDSSDTMGKLQINNSSFFHCGGNNKSIHSCRYATTFIYNEKCQVTNCHFVNCWHETHGYIDPPENMCAMFTSDSTQENCTFENSASFKPQ